MEQKCHLLLLCVSPLAPRAVVANNFSCFFLYSLISALSSKGEVLH